VGEILKSSNLFSDKVTVESKKKTTSQNSKVKVSNNVTNAVDNVQKVLVSAKKVGNKKG
jgi:hypothetical protein